MALNTRTGKSEVILTSSGFARVGDAKSFNHEQQNDAKTQKTEGWSKKNGRLQDQCVNPMKAICQVPFEVEVSVPVNVTLTVPVKIPLKVPVDVDAILEPCQYPCRPCYPEDQHCQTADTHNEMPQKPSHVLGKMQAEIIQEIPKAQK